MVRIIMTIIECVERFWLVVCLSILGGIAGGVSRKERKFIAFVGGCFVAAFAGLVTFMLLDEISTFSEQTKTAIASIFAYSGGKGLDLITDRLASVFDAIAGKAGKPD